MKIKIHKNDVINVLSKAVCCGLIPILGCILYCMFQGQSLKSIYLPNTASADDIFYYKMVAGMVNFGSPLEYFGYNESHAMVSSFGVWSPILLMPWALWGKVFGWGYSSPIMCNICMLSSAFAVFAVLAKPTWKQIISIALLFLPVIPFTTYVLSGRPEIVGYSLIIIMYGIVYSYYKRENTYKLIMVFVIVTILSLMRPYFMIFLIFSGILWVRRSKLVGLTGMALIIFLNLSGYMLMTHFFSAPYFYSSMATDFIEAFQNDGFFSGCFFLLHKIYDKWIVIRWEMSLGVRQGFTDGQIYFACCIAMLFLFMWLLLDFIKMRHPDSDKDRNKDNNIVQNMALEASQLLSFIIMLLAIIVLYQIMEGSRHILVFFLGFIIVGVMRNGCSLEKNILIVAAFAYLFIVRYDEASLYRVPYANEGVIQEVENLSSKFSSYISLNCVDAPSYENVVDWVTEEVADGEKREIPWKALSALPDGVGISCCLPQYIAENIDELNGRYIIAISNGGTDLLCQEKEMDMLMRDEYFALYKTY